MATKAARARYIAAIFLIALVFAAFFGAYFGSSRQSPDENGNGAYTERADDRIARYTQWLALFTAALAVVSGIQISFLIRADKTARITANATTNSVTTARDSVRRQLRAYVHVANAQVFYNRSNPAQCYVAVAIKNYGQTPALNATFLMGEHVRE
jgi:hypothetical protein